MPRASPARQRRRRRAVPAGSSVPRLDASLHRHLAVLDLGDEEGVQELMVDAVALLAGPADGPEDRRRAFELLEGLAHLLDVDAVRLLERLVEDPRGVVVHDGDPRDRALVLGPIALHVTLHCRVT